LTFYVVTPQR